MKILNIEENFLVLVPQLSFRSIVMYHFKYYKKILAISLFEDQLARKILYIKHNMSTSVEKNHNISDQGGRAPCTIREK